MRVIEVILDRPFDIGGGFDQFERLRRIAEKKTGHVDRIDRFAEQGYAEFTGQCMGPAQVAAKNTDTIGVLVLRIVWGLTNAEIAEREGIPLATVGTWLRRGRADLHRALRPLLREMREEAR